MLSEDIQPNIGPSTFYTYNVWQNELSEKKSFLKFLNWTENFLKRFETQKIIKVFISEMKQHVKSRAPSKRYSETTITQKYNKKLILQC